MTSPAAAARSNGATGRSTAPGSSTPDPSGELRFLVKGGDLSIGNFAECGGLAMEYEVMEYQEGGQLDFVHKLRGQLKYSNLTLKRGVTHEAALLEWFFRARSTEKRPTVTIFLVGPDAQVVRHWAFASAFPVKWTGPNLNAGSTSIATETLEIAHAGLVRNV
jgi:phage tail-like protein